MPCQRNNRRWSARGRQSVENGELGKESCDQDRAIFVAVVYSSVRDHASDTVVTYPIAYVRQSVAGAKEVIGSKIVRAEICSEVEGSKRITSPLPLPISNKRQPLDRSVSRGCHFPYRMRRCHCASTLQLAGAQMMQIEQFPCR